jgi:hypothetical protein
MNKLLSLTTAALLLGSATITSAPAAEPCNKNSKEDVRGTWFLYMTGVTSISDPSDYLAGELNQPIGFECRIIVDSKGQVRASTPCTTGPIEGLLEVRQNCTVSGILFIDNEQLAHPSPEFRSNCHPQGTLTRSKDAVHGLIYCQAGSTEAYLTLTMVRR